MKKYKIFLIQIIALFFTNLIIAQNKAIHSKGNLVKISQKLTQLQGINESSLYSIYDKKGQKKWPKSITKPNFFPQTRQSNISFNNNLVQKVPFGSKASFNNHIIRGFEGLATGVLPMDPTIAVGNDYVIELVNAAPTSKMRIWDKNGNVLINQITLQAISGFPGYGDPIALYDKVNDRYIVTEFMIKNYNNSTENGLIIMVSQNNNPTGSWYVYKWVINENLTLDYPKWAVNSDGIFVHTNNFSQNKGSFQGSYFIAFNKSQMYSGSTYFDALKTAQSSGDNYTKYATCPAQPQGDVNSSTNQIFVTKQNNHIILIETPVDWSTNSFTQDQIAQIPIVNYNDQICSAYRQRCIHQPDNGHKLEALNYRIMNQPILREFNNYTGIVLSFTVNANNKAGIRWVELMKNGEQWQLKQESTWHINSNHHFMPSIAYDKFGNISLAYSTSSTSLFPSIRYTGRYTTDPLNQMTLPENILKDGNAVSLSSRWGDYNHLVADPDGNSFWMVAMYGKSGAPFGEGTYITNFSLVDPCPVDLTITQDVLSGETDIQEASNTITATNTIFSGGTAEYDAGNFVLLDVGFKAEAGQISKTNYSHFYAYIDGCTGKVERDEYSSANDNSSEDSQSRSMEEYTPIKLYPNPTKGVLTIESDSEVISWEIRSAFGDLKFTGGNTKQTIDTSNLPNGIYYLRGLLKDAKIFSRTFIKQ